MLRIPLLCKYQKTSRQVKNILNRKTPTVLDLAFPPPIHGKKMRPLRVPFQSILAAERFWLRNRNLWLDRCEIVQRNSNIQLILGVYEQESLRFWPCRYGTGLPATVRCFGCFKVVWPRIQGLFHECPPHPEKAIS